MRWIWGQLTLIFSLLVPLQSLTRNKPSILIIMLKYVKVIILSSEVCVRGPYQLKQSAPNTEKFVYYVY